MAKKGVEGVPSNLALFVRVCFVVVFAFAFVLISKQIVFGQLTSRNWIFLGVSGLGTFLSWLCYFRALQLGPVSRVAPIDKLSFVLAMVMGVIFLREKVTLPVVGGAVVISIGVLLTLL